MCQSSSGIGIVGRGSPCCPCQRESVLRESRHLPTSSCFSSSERKVREILQRTHTSQYTLPNYAGAEPEARDATPQSALRVSHPQEPPHHAPQTARDRKAPRTALDCAHPTARAPTRVAPRLHVQGEGPSSPCPVRLSLHSPLSSTRPGDGVGCRARISLPRLLLVLCALPPQFAPPLPPSGLCLSSGYSQLRHAGGWTASTCSLVACAMSCRTRDSTLRGGRAALLPPVASPPVSRCCACSTATSASNLATDAPSLASAAHGTAALSDAASQPPIGSSTR